MRVCATPATQNDRGCKIVPRLPRRSEAAPPASRPPKPGPRAPPSTISATPATQNDGTKRRYMRVCATPATQNDRGCKIVPRLPRRSEAAPPASRPPKPGPRAPPSTISATPATQNDGRCEFVPHLLRETKVNVTKCHACHAECRGVTRDQGAPKPDQARHPVPSVPRLPRKTMVDCIIICEVRVCEIIVCKLVWD